MRSRLTVAETRQWTTLTEDDNTTQTFLATPPYEALRPLVSFTMSLRNSQQRAGALMFIDITRAHPHCTMPCEMWILAVTRGASVD